MCWGGPDDSFKTDFGSFILKRTLCPSAVVDAVLAGTYDVQAAIISGGSGAVSAQCDVPGDDAGATLLIHAVKSGNPKAVEIALSNYCV